MRRSRSIARLSFRIYCTRNRLNAITTSESFRCRDSQSARARAFLGGRNALVSLSPLWMAELRRCSCPLRVRQIPTSAQCFVKLDNNQPAIEFCLRECNLRRVELLLSFQDFVVARKPLHVALHRKL